MNKRPAESVGTLPVTAFLIALGTMVLGPGVLAGPTTLDAEDAEALIAGNTLAGFMPKDQSEYTTFYSSSGQVRSMIVRNDKRDSVIGRWWINEDGKLCNDWETYGYINSCHGVGYDGETVIFVDESGRIISFAELRTGNSEGL